MKDGLQVQMQSETKEALLIIDVQNDYFPSGRCELDRPDLTLTVIKQLIMHFRENHQPVYFIQHLSEKGAAFFEVDTEGVNIHEDIRPLATEKVIIKHHPNSFFETDLQGELKKAGITDLTVCGMMTHMCVDTIVRAAKDFGYCVTLIEDACATKDLEWGGEKIPAAVVQSVYMASLNHKFVKVITSDEYFSIQKK